jgi:hypothetical protein
LTFAKIFNFREPGPDNEKALIPAHLAPLGYFHCPVSVHPEGCIIFAGPIINLQTLSFQPAKITPFAG